MIDLMKSKANWNSINWLEIQSSIDIFQKRLFYLSKSNNIVKVRLLQRMLFHSRKAKLISIYRVYQQSKFLFFKGFDSFTKINNFHGCQLGLVMGKNIFFSFSRHLVFFDFNTSRMYSLFISNFADRCQQELFKIIMQPEWDAKFRSSSFSFRPGKSCFDLLSFVQKILSKNYKYSFLTKFSKSFTLLNFNILLREVNFLGILKYQLLFWIKRFFSYIYSIHNSSVYFQGRPIFILLISVILHGLDFRLIMFSKKNVLTHKFFYVFTYFNNLLILHSNLIFIFFCKKIIFRHLKQLGFLFFDFKLNIAYVQDLFLENKSKSNFSQLKDFSFLGFNFHYYSYKNKFRLYSLKNITASKIFVYPSAVSVLKHQKRLHFLVLKSGKRLTQKILIEKLNLIIIADYIFFFYDCYTMDIKLIKHCSQSIARIFDKK